MLKLNFRARQRDSAIDQRRGEAARSLGLRCRAVALRLSEMQLQCGAAMLRLRLRRSAPQPQALGITQTQTQCARDTARAAGDSHGVSIARD